MSLDAAKVNAFSALSFSEHGSANRAFSRRTTRNPLRFPPRA